MPCFYESVGYGERALDPDRWDAVTVVEALEQAMGEGAVKDEAFMMSVYETLFSGLKSVVAPDSEHTAYSYAQLREHLPRYSGTTAGQYRAKVRRTLRRTYRDHGLLVANQVAPPPPSLGRRVAGRAWRLISGGP